MDPDRLRGAPSRRSAMVNNRPTPGVVGHPVHACTDEMRMQALLGSRCSTTDGYGIGGEVTISTLATININPPSTMRPSRIRKNRKWPLIPIRNRIVAR